MKNISRKQKKRKGKKWSEEEERYRTILDEIEEGYYEVDLTGNFTFVNNVMVQLLGYSHDELMGMNYSIFTPKEELKYVFDTFNKVFRTGEILRHFPFSNIRKDGTMFSVEDSISPLRNKKGKITGFRGVVRDITERKKKEEEIIYLANHDGLTELPNRRYFENFFTDFLFSAQRHQIRFAVMMIDLDHLKKVNDIFGHKEGDSLIQRVAKELSVSLRKEDKVARLGGDEFAILLREIANFTDSTFVIKKIRESLAEIQGYDMKISASIGVAVYPEDGEDYDTLMMVADSRMYEEKRGHNNSNK